MNTVAKKSNLAAPGCDDSKETPSTLKPSLETCIWEIDARKPTKPRSQMFRQSIGSCHAYVTLRQDWREQSAMVQEAVGFKQCRFHGIFNDWMGTCGRSETGEIVTNFVNVDKVYQGILDLGMKPFVEIGYMPEALASGTQTCFAYRANVTPPKDYNEWRDFIRCFVEHLIEQFGRNEVASWRFEVWNEPDLSYFWQDANQDEYFKLYAETVKVIKAIEPAIRVGGPATSKNAWVREMLEFCENTDTPLDFISTHHYCSDSALELGEPSDKLVYFGQKKMLKDVAAVRKLIDGSAFPEAELHYTEWSVSPAHNDRFGKDSEFTMTFVLQTLKDLADVPDSYSYWTINDIFEESGPGVGPFSGKYGLVNINGIKKPAFHAYAYLGLLFDHEIHHENESLMVTTDGKGFRLLAWNHCEPLAHDFSGGEWTINSVARKEAITLKGLRGHYRIRAWQVDRFRGNSYRAWQDMGEPAYLNKAQVQSLSEAAEPVCVSDELVHADSTLMLSHTLLPNSLIYYEIEAV